MNKKEESWRHPMKKIRSNCGGCQKRHEAMQRQKQALAEALTKKFGRK